MSSSRRLFIAATSGAALAACAGGTLLSRNANEPTARTAPPNTTPLTFVNRSETASADVFFVYYGLDPMTNEPRYLIDANGTLGRPKPTNGTPNASLAMSIAQAKRWILPQLRAARLYISTGMPMSFNVDPVGNPLPPNSFSKTDPNYTTPWDFFEITYIPWDGAQNGNFGLNLSTVQSSNIPMQFRLTGTQPGSNEPLDYVRGWNPGGYAAFVDALASNADFRRLILPGTGNRVLAPGTAITAYGQKQIPLRLISETYFDEYVAVVWKKFSSKTLTFVGDPPPYSNEFVVWLGKVVNNQFVFLPQNEDLQLAPITFDAPSTNDLFENTVFCAEECGQSGDLQQDYMLQIFGTLCAAFNRSMMLVSDTLANAPNSTWCRDTKDFYRDETTNYYAKFVHENMIDHYAYAFQSDDHCDQSSYVQANDAGLTITLHAS